MSALFRQTSGDQIGTVIQLADGSFDTLAKLLAYVLLVVNDGGDGENRYLRLSSDVIDTRRLRRFLATAFF